MNESAGPRRTVAPQPEGAPVPGRRDPFPQLLLLLTVASGVVDAISYLRFGHVFVANMTGNIVFLGFAAAGAPGLSVAGSLIALAAFLIGSFSVGRLVARLSGHGPRLLALCVIGEAVVAGIVLALVAFAGLTQATTYAAIALLALTMGTQNAMARKLAIPDLTTTVLTMTLTGIAADLNDDLAGGRATPRLRRRIAAVLAMLLGAFAGAALVLRVGIVAGLALVFALFAITAVGAAPHARAETQSATA